MALRLATGGRGTIALRNGEANFGPTLEAIAGAKSSCFIDHCIPDLYHLQWLPVHFWLLLKALGQGNLEHLLPPTLLCVALIHVMFYFEDQWGAQAEPDQP